MKVIDITAVAKIVRRTDVGATWQAFIAFFIPFAAAVGFVALAILLPQVVVVFESFDLDDPSYVFLIAGFICLALSSPVLFVGADWLRRREASRHLAALFAALVGTAGVMIILFLTNLILGAIEEALDSEEAWKLTTGAAAVLFWTTLWLFSRRRWQRWLLLILPSALLVFTGYSLWHTFREEPEELTETVLMSLAVIGGIALFTHFIRVRLATSEPYPRALLFGAVEPEYAARRIAFLLGLPSSHWNGRALSMGSFWAFVLARPISYVGLSTFRVPEHASVTGLAIVVTLASLFLTIGHFLFYLGKRLAARRIWNPNKPLHSKPILFLRSFSDDQFKFPVNWWNAFGRWLDLWSFRRNVDETLIDEFEQYGPVIALGRPGDKKAPFGALRRYSSNDDWEALIRATIRESRAVIICAGDSPGVLKEFDLLREEQFLHSTILLFRPSKAEAETNRRALKVFAGIDAHPSPQQVWIAYGHFAGEPLLITAAKPSATAYLVALRGFFQNCTAAELQGIEAESSAQLPRV